MQPLRLEQLPFGLELGSIPGELFFDGADGLLRAVAGRHEVGLRIDGDLVVPPQGLSGQRIEGRQHVDFVTEQLDPYPCSSYDG